MPAPNVTMIGSSPLESPDETWGVGHGNGAGKFYSPLVRYTREGGWSLGPRYEDAAGNPLTSFRLAAPDGATPSPLAGQMTPAGSGVLGGEVLGEGAEAPRQVILVRDPGGAFRETAALPEAGEDALQLGESLFMAGRAPLLAPLDEGSGKAGALVVPVKESGPETGVLHWDGKAWTREPIAVPSASSSDFKVLAIGANSPTNAWLLAQLSSSSSYPVGAVALFRRRPPSGELAATWEPVQLTPGAGDEEAHPLSANGSIFTVAHLGEPPTVQAQLLTVTGEGLWVDGERVDIRSSTTMFFKPSGQAGGETIATWCSIPPANAGATPCTHELPDPLPTGPSRSFAWTSSGTPEGLGERVITGFPEGVSAASRRHVLHARAGARRQARSASGRCIRSCLLERQRGLARAAEAADAPDAQLRREPADAMARVVPSRAASDRAPARSSGRRALQPGARGGRRG